MCDQVEEIRDGLRRLVGRLDPARLATSDAMRLVEVFAQTERLAVAGRTIAAGKVEESRGWQETGRRTAAEWVASKTQGTIGEAIASLQNARHLQDLPATRKEFLAGKLSERQVAELAPAAAAAPSFEGSLLQAAKQDSFVAFRDRCREIVASATADEDRDERIRRARYFRHWMDGEGAIRVDGRFTAGDGAFLIAAIASGVDRFRAEARRSGIHEPGDAYAADALISLARGENVRPAVVHLEVDAEAFTRGWTEAGDTCRIRGVGPVSIATARKLTTAGLLKFIGRDGADVTAVTHHGRAIPARVRTALEARDPTCVVPGCDVRSGLEIDHIVPIADGGPTRLDNLVRLCRYHHAGKTHQGWRIGGKPGAWTWTKGPLRPRRHPARE